MFRFVKKILLLLLTGAVVSCTIVKNDQNAGGSSSQNRAFSFTGANARFDTKEYAAEIWDAVVIPRVEGMSEDYKTLIASLEADEEAASQTYGYRLIEEGNHYNFAVKGTVALLSIDTSSRNGTASLDFAPFDGTEDCRMSIGPVLRGSTLRDIQNSLSLDDFGNQVEFARLATELNNKVKETVLADIDFTQAPGREADVTGVFTYEGRDSVITIMPVRFNFRE
jgi:predicted lipoprotein